MDWLRTLIARLRAFRQHLANRRTFKLQLLSAVGDGRLTPDQISHLDSLKKQLQLSDDDVRPFRFKAYLSAYSAVKRDTVITREEDVGLDGVQRYLGIVDSEIAGPKRELAHFRLLREIQGGTLPTVDVPGLVLQKNETAHWSEAASIVEERVVDRQFVGGSSGVSFRIARGVSYRVGNFRGHTVTKRAVVPVSTGSLVITSKRLVFLGDNKGFNSRLDKLLDVHLFAHGLRVEDGAGRPHNFVFESRGNIDVIGAILTHAVNSVAD